MDLDAALEDIRLDSPYSTCPIEWRQALNDSLPPPLPKWHKIHRAQNRDFLGHFAPHPSLNTGEGYCICQILCSEAIE